MISGPVRNVLAEYVCVAELTRDLRVPAASAIGKGQSPAHFSLAHAAALGRGWRGRGVVIGGGRRRGRSCVGALDGGGGGSGRSRGGSCRCDDVVGVAWVVQADDVEDRLVRLTKAFVDADGELQIPDCLGVESTHEKVVDVVKVDVAELAAVVDLCLGFAGVLI